MRYIVIENNKNEEKGCETVANIDTVIGMNVISSRNRRSGKRSALDEQQVLHEISTMIEAAREKLDDVIIRYDARDKDTAELDRAADALDNAVDSIDEVLSAYED